MYCCPRVLTARFGRINGSCTRSAIDVAFFPKESSMKWTPGGESQDIEDRRDESGGGGGFQFGGMHIGIGGALILLILSFVFKTNLFTLLSGGGADSGPATVRQPNPARDAAERPLVEFV